VTEAIDHIVAAGDFDRAGEIIAAHWIAHLNAGRIATVKAWLKLIGDERISSHPAIAITAAWVAGSTGERGAARHGLAAAERVGHNGPLPDGTRSLESA